MVGTTVHAGDEVPASFRDAFRNFGVALSGEELANVRGRSKVEAVRALVARRLPGLEHPAETSAEIHAHFVATLRERYASGARAVPGAEATLGWLRDRGAEVVLSTGLDRVTASGVLEALGWETMVRLVAGDDVARGRPAPDLILEAMRLVGVGDPSVVVAVGDTDADLGAAAAAQVAWNVGVLTGAHPRGRLVRVPHSVLLESVADLPEWLAGELDARQV